MEIGASRRVVEHLDPAVPHRERRILRQQLLQWNGGPIQARAVWQQTLERILYCSGERCDQGRVANRQGTQVLIGHAIELSHVDRNVHAVRPHIDHFQRGVFSDLVLESEIPAERIGVGRLRADETHGLSRKGPEASRRAGRRDQTGRERICQRAGLREIAVAGSDELRGLTEALLIQDRVGGVGAGDRQLADVDRLHKHCKSATNHRLSLEQIGSPGKAGARTKQM